MEKKTQLVDPISRFKLYTKIHRLFDVMWRTITFLFVGLTMSFVARSQADTIKLKNGSFEDFPRHSRGVKGWITCGFPQETPPDVQPFKNVDVTWGQLIEAHKGETYLGMVVRDNDTYEQVSQPLSSPVQAGQCYEFSIYLSSSDNYMSPAHKSGQMENYVKPAVLRIWGGNEYCDRAELLGESPTIAYKSWYKYDFVFKPKGNYSYIMLEAFYKTPTLFVYNGNILLDGASDLIPIPCPDEIPEVEVVNVIDIVLEGDPIASVEPSNDNEGKTQSVKKVEPKPKKEDPVIASASVARPSPKPPKERILKNLEREKLVKGQTIRIDNLYFQSDSARIDSNSIEVLEEVAYFLSQNKDVVVEIGGHTSGKPTHEYCDKLSNDRAESVSNYLMERGITENQVKHKGYGKRKPLASNQTKWGRQRNQRVEIRILSINGR